MKNPLLLFINFGLMFLMVLSETKLTSLKGSITDIFLGERQCKFLEVPIIEAVLNNTFEICDRKLPDYDSVSKNYRQFLPDIRLCFGFFDSLSDVCQLENLSPKSVNYSLVEDLALNEKIFCNKIREFYNSSNQGKSVDHVDNMEKWRNDVEQILRDDNKCKELCILRKEVTQFCSAIYITKKIKKSIESQSIAKDNQQNTDKSITVENPKIETTENKLNETPSKLPPATIAQQTAPSKVISLPKTSKPLEKTEINEEEQNISEPSLKDSEKGMETSFKDPDAEGTLSKQEDGESNDHSSDRLGTEEFNDNPRDDLLADTPQVSKQLKDYTGITQEDDSSFFPYFVFMVVMSIFGYMAFHNKNKLIALLVEGRREKGRRSRSEQRHGSVTYSKLHSNLEEAVSSNASAPSATHVLY